MIIFTLRTDNPQAEVGLFDNETKLNYEIWTAHRQLAESIHINIRKLLMSQNKEWHDIEGIVFYKGPGSFTGLRIGLSVVNALANSLSLPIIGTTGNDWYMEGIGKLLAKENDKQIILEYGSEPHVTTPKNK